MEILQVSTMNMQPTAVLAPPAPKRMSEMQLPIVMMRDILLKTIFRKTVENVSEISEAICLPVTVTQELVDMARSQKLLEATGTLNANNGNEMGYQLTDAGKARALDALSQSEYFGAMPVPLELYREQVKRQSIRNIQVTRDQLVKAMGHLVLPDSLLGHLGPAVSAGRSILMYGPPGTVNPRFPMASATHWVTMSMCRAPSNTPGRSLPFMTRSCTLPSNKNPTTRPNCAAGPGSTAGM